MPGHHEFLGWFYHDARGRQVGPITTDSLKALVTDGTLKPSHMVTKAYGDEGRDHVYLYLVREALDKTDPGPSP